MAEEAVPAPPKEAEEDKSAVPAPAGTNSEPVAETPTPPHHKLEAAVKISGLAPKTTAKDIQEFLSYAGTIVVIDWLPPNKEPEEAFVGFAEKKAEENAVLLNEARLKGNIVTVVPAPVDQALSSAAQFLGALSDQTNEHPLKQAEGTLRRLFEGSVALGAEALAATAAKAKDLDEKHQLSTAVAARAADAKTAANAVVGQLQKKIADAPEAISRSVSVGKEQVSQSVSAVSQSISEIDSKYKMTEKAQGVFSLAEQRLNEVGTFFLQNKVISQGRDFLIGTAAKVSEAVEGSGVASSEVGLVRVDGSGPGDKGSDSTGPTAGGEEKAASHETDVQEKGPLGASPADTPAAPGGVPQAQTPPLPEPQSTKGEEAAKAVDSVKRHEKDDVPVF